MFSIQNLLFALCIPLSCVSSAAGLIHVFGYEGEDVEVSCPYDWGYESYEKYLCKNDCGNDDVLIKTTATNTLKYSIDDDNQKHVFTATIANLRYSDAGKYWCGVSRTGKDIYTEVKLEVRPDSCCDKSNKVEGYEESSVSISCPYESNYQNSVKYICRGKRPSKCLEKAVITSANEQNGQFRLMDDKASRKFIVTITSLTQNNSGWYLCGVHENTGLDVFSAFELEVNEWCCVKPTKLSAIVGHSVTMQCPYPPQHRHNRKFLCKGDYRNNCTDVEMRQSNFTLQADLSSGYFTVTIMQLKAVDAGTYWCGSDSQWSVGNYTTIQLSVVFPKQSSTEIAPVTLVEPVGSQSTQIPGKPIRDAAPFHAAVVIVPTLLLVLAFALVVVCIYKRYKVPGVRAKITAQVRSAAELDEYATSSKQGSSKPQHVCQSQDDAGEAQQESVYQNFDATEDIYCNDVVIRANRR